MARFIYRMQSILDIKTKMEEQAKMEFAAARMRLDEEEEKQRVLEERKNAYEEKGRMLRRDSLKVPEIMENQDAMARMDEFIALQQKNVEKAQQQLEEARVSLQMAMQESKTQEKLKEKAFEEFIHEENVREAKEVDELTSYVYGRAAQLTDR